MAVLYGPGGHGGGVGVRVGHAGHHHGHDGGAAAVGADGIGAVRLAGPLLRGLIEVDDVHVSAGENLAAVPLQQLGEGGRDDRAPVFRRVALRRLIVLQLNQFGGGELLPELGGLPGGLMGKADNALAGLLGKSDHFLTNILAELAGSV